MSFFVVFNRRGLSLFSKGTPPPYLNSLIRTLPNLRSFSRAIQSDFCFAQSSVFEVFLGIYSINDPELLTQDIAKYRQNTRDGIDERNSESVEQKEDQNALKAPKNSKDKNISEETDKSIKENINKDITENENNNQQKESVLMAQKEKRTDESQINVSKAPSKSIRTPSFISSRIKELTFGLFSKAQSKDAVRSLLETQLHSQNVSPSIADRILSETLAHCPETVSAADCRSLVRKAVGSVIGRINHEELVREVKDGSPFIFAFVGPNGVGKSTSVAKTACWLMRQGVRCLLVACDVFRAGAVEQLTAHAQSLSCDIFDRGYSKCEASVLRQALVYAQKNAYDAVLVDTAGRTPHSQALMEGLKKLLRLIPHAHVCYVAEALCGNDSEDHAAKFSQAARLSSVFITKVDAAGMMGQVLNLCVYANAPVLFVGTGQAHTSLETIEPQNIADMLLSAKTTA